MPRGRHCPRATRGTAWTTLDDSERIWAVLDSFIRARTALDGPGQLWVTLDGSRQRMDGPGRL